MPAEVPSGWASLRFDEVATVERGLTYSNEQECAPDFPGVSCVLRIPNVQNQLFLEEDLKYIKDVSAKQVDKYSVPRGSILMVGSNGNADRVGNCCFVESSRPYLFASFLMRVVPDVAFSDPRFFYYLVAGGDVQAAITDSVAGTTGLKNISLEMLRNYSLALPPLPEQKMIAAILSSVDEAIQATQAVIDQTRRVKEGLLQDLLTRGIGHTRFKQTEIGEIPESWEVARVKDLLAPVEPAMRSGPFGSALLKQELVEHGIPVLGIDNVHVERFVADYRRFITPEKFKTLSRYSVRPDDVMITIMGTVGRCCLVPPDVGTAISSKHTWTLTFDQEKCRPYLMCAQFNYAPWVLRHFEVDGQGGMMEAIRSETLRNAAVPLPPLAEQVAIERVLKSVDENGRSHRLALEYLTAMKAGLLHDLLNGRVRVSP